MKDTGWQNMDMDFVRYLITLLKTYYPYFVNYLEICTNLQFVHFQLLIFEMPWLLNVLQIYKLTSSLNIT
ncbi:Motile sperm domain-containing protein 2 [Orchesella cincta]|uniref:Motile sperm domain-containing protein 2 n=1 Tax=Orchesella cincta TaxID=48709 RepID=A0A1D2MJL5_ORCCI|nr:Motile sperm domain-containing protein 2 [Orchesella cincta]